VSLLPETDVVQRDLERVKDRIDQMMIRVNFDCGSYPIETYDRLADLKRDCEDLCEYLDTYSSYDPG
jgi:hypothetical protein